MAEPLGPSIQEKLKFLLILHRSQDLDGNIHSVRTYVCYLCLALLHSNELIGCELSPKLCSVYLLIKSDSSVTVTPNPRMSMCARSTLYRHCPKKWHSFCYSFLIACLINHIILVFVRFSNLPQSANLFKSSSKNTETSESVFESYMIDQKIKDI